jgi:hypothetical protein
MAKTFPNHWLGLVASGDVGDLTVYTDRKMRLIAYPRRPPECPATPRQLENRDRFRRAVRAWLALPDLTRFLYELLAKRNSLCATGQNVWLHFALTYNVPQWNTLCFNAFPRMALQQPSLAEITIDAQTWWPALLEDDPSLSTYRAAALPYPYCLDPNRPPPAAQPTAILLDTAAQTWPPTPS